MNQSAEPGFEYQGSELELFAHAVRWKAYWSSRIAPHVRGRVLEAGAGIGANTALLANLDWQHWTCLEPDAALAGQIPINDPQRYERIVGTTADLDPARSQYDSILYIDVLEHIEDDRAEMTRAAGLLAPGGHIIVLSPAHQWLYSPFDKAIGHFRRYSRESLAAAAPGQLLREVKLRYLDAVGLLASGANRLLLAQSMPTLAQIKTWDRWMVPVSRRLLDPLLAGRAGKSVLGVWTRR